MPVTISGTTGIAGVDGSAGTPAVQGGDSNTGVFFPAADTVAIATNGTEAMRVDSSQNVGIGTSSPGAKLQVNGPAAVTSFTGTTRLGVLVGGSTSTNDYSGVDFIGGGSSNPTARIAVLSGSAGSSITFGTSNSYASGITNSGMILDNSGNLGIGATSAYGRLAVTDAVDRTQTTSQFSVSGNGYTLFMHLDGTAAYIGQNSGARSLRMYSGSSTASGVNLAAGGTSWGTYSDERLKTNLVPITDASNKVQQLRAVTGRYKTDDEGVSRSFLIAQDVQAVLPEAIDESDPEALGLRYTEVIPLLVAAIKEQQGMLQELTAKLDAAEARIAALEAA